MLINNNYNLMVLYRLDQLLKIRSNCLDLTVFILTGQRLNTKINIIILNTKKQQNLGFLTKHKFNIPFENVEFIQ